MRRVGGLLLQAFVQRVFRIGECVWEGDAQGRETGRPYGYEQRRRRDDAELQVGEARRDEILPRQNVRNG